MSPMNERLELRLDVDFVDRIDEWRAEQSDLPSRSEAVRRLVERGLSRQGVTKEDFRLDNTDKLTIWMLSEVLKNQLKPKSPSAADYDLRTVDLIQEAIYGGHFWGLGWEMTGVFHKHVDDPHKVNAVVDILDMWFFVETAYARFTDDEKAFVAKEAGWSGKNPMFAGFDGNNEGEYMSIAQFLVEKMGRFQHFKGRDFNSHSRTVAKYGQMAGAFESMRKGLQMRQNLSPSDVVKLLKMER